MELFDGETELLSVMTKNKGYAMIEEKNYGLKVDKKQGFRPLIIDF